MLQPQPEVNRYLTSASHLPLSSSEVQADRRFNGTDSGLVLLAAPIEWSYWQHCSSFMERVWLVRSQNLPLSEWVSEWVSDCVSDWVTEWVIDRLSERAIEWASDWVGDWLSDWMSEWVSERAKTSFMWLLQGWGLNESATFGLNGNHMNILVTVAPNRWQRSLRSSHEVPMFRSILQSRSLPIRSPKLSLNVILKFMEWIFNYFEITQDLYRAVMYSKISVEILSL
jgi:hypothetical protein